MPLRLIKSKQEEFDAEELFLSHYERVFDWALHLTAHDRERAEDLVHDLFVQLSLNPPKTERIENWENYLFIVLRNLHRFQKRREQRGNLHRQLSITDYDSLETGLQTAFDFDRRLQIWQELQTACGYACRRKETSRAGSAFILRFFHGYYPSEIARILCGSRSAVGELLRVARSEVRAAAENPAQISFLKTGDTTKIIPKPAPENYSSETIISELREQIFAARTGKCLPAQMLADIYEIGSAELVDRARLAHFVSCADCLRRINKILGLPDLSNRFPPDMLGPESADKREQPRSKLKSVKPAAKPNKRQSLEKFRRKLQAIHEHEPRELWVAVNDSILGTQPIVAATSEQTLGLETIEDVRFVSVFSEQNICLCALSVESPPAGDFEQTANISLSDDRKLQINLSFCGNWRHVQVIYSDPALESVGAEKFEPDDSIFCRSPHEVRAQNTIVSGEFPPAENTLASSVFPQTENTNEQLNTDTPTKISLWLRFVRWLFDWFAPFLKREFWLRPMTITVLFAVPLIALLVVWRLSVPEEKPFTGKQIIEQAAIAERNFAPNFEQGSRRVLEVEEQQAASGKIIARRRIEIWRRAVSDAGEYTTTRRVSDEKGNVIAGEWLKTDGTRLRKNLINQPRTSAGKKSNEPETEIAEAVWLEPSVANLENLTGGAVEQIKISENENSFVLEAAAPEMFGVPPSGGNSRRVINSASRRDSELLPLNQHPTVKRISLTVSKTDYRATAQSIWVGTGGEEREFRFVETKFEPRAVSEIPENIFNPDALRPDLPTRVIKPNEQIILPPNDAPQGETANSNSITPVVAPNVKTSAATAEMEIEALNLLNAAKADLNEQISVERVPNGVLQIKGIVETPERKAEILRALAPLAANPAVEIKIQTVAEAVAAREKQKNANSKTANETILEQKEADGNTLAAEEDLRRFFTARGVAAEKLDAEIREFAQNAFARSRRIAQHAGALRQTAARFSAAEVENLTPEARAAWRAILKKHARNLKAETFALRSTLAPVFGGNSGAVVSETVNTNDVAAVRTAAANLSALAGEIDRNIRAAFSASADSSPAAKLKTKNFRDNLERAERLAAALAEN